MRVSIRRRWFLLIAMALVPMLTVAGAPRWAANTLTDMWDYPEASRIIQEAGEQRELLDAESECVYQRIQVKETILDELEIGRVNLFDAAKQFYILDRDRPCVSQMLYPPERLGSEFEIAATSVIRHLRSRGSVKKRPGLAETIHRLEREYESAFGYDPPE